LFLFYFLVTAWRQKVHAGGGKNLRIIEWKKILQSSNTLRIEKWAYFLGLSIMSFKLAPIFYFLENSKIKIMGDIKH
jgi:hypothetical protein